MRDTSSPPDAGALSPRQAELSPGQAETARPGATQPVRLWPSLPFGWHWRPLSPGLRRGPAPGTEPCLPGGPGPGPDPAATARGPAGTIGTAHGPGSAAQDPGRAGWGIFAWPWQGAWVDVAWAVFSLVNLVAIVVFSHWETIPFHFIWISLTLLYGFRVWATRPTLWVLAVVMVTTFAAISMDVWRGAQSVDELNEVPLMAMMFWMMVWHAQRRLAADQEREAVSEENARLLATQRRFLQDASHQLRTPITIALGHAELLAQELTDRPERRDIQVVVGELARLRRLGERLLVIAASEDPDFLRPELIALDRFTMDLLRRWRPTAGRRWRAGRLDRVTVSADRERLALAVDALLENAVRHTASDDEIQLSVVASGPLMPVRMIVADTGSGIPPSELEHVFDRFRSGSPAAGSAAITGSKGTGLGLALVRAVAHAHGGDVRVRSTPGQGSEFELVLPAPALNAVAGPAAVPLSWAGRLRYPGPDAEG